MNDQEGGESLTIADPEEVWIFAISPDDTGTSAVWAAQRVPDDEVETPTFVSLFLVPICNPFFFLDFSSDKYVQYRGAKSTEPRFFYGFRQYFRRGHPREFMVPP